MAEFCIDCFNRINKTNYSKYTVTLGEDFCEGCGVQKPCVMFLKPTLLSILKCLKEDISHFKSKSKN